MSDSSGSEQKKKKQFPKKPPQQQQDQVQAPPDPQAAKKLLAYHLKIMRVGADQPPSVGRLKWVVDDLYKIAGIRPPGSTSSGTRNELTYEQARTLLWQPLMEAAVDANISDHDLLARIMQEASRPFESSAPEVAATTPPSSDGKGQNSKDSDSNGGGNNNGVDSSSRGSTASNSLSSGTSTESLILPPSQRLFKPPRPLPTRQAAQRQLINDLSELARLGRHFPDLLSNESYIKKYLQKIVDALYVALQTRVGLEQDLSRIPPEDLVRQLMDELIMANFHVRPRITDDYVLPRILNEAHHLYPPFDPAAQLSTVAPEPSGNWHVTRAASSLSGITPVGTPAEFRNLVGRLRAIQLLPGERDFRNRALARAVEALNEVAAVSPDRVYTDEQGHVQRRPDDDPALLIQTLNRACQTASPPIHDRTLICMVIDAALPENVDRGPLPPEYVTKQWRQRLLAAIKEDQAKPLGDYPGTPPTNIHYARAIPILLAFAQFYFSWNSERWALDYGHPRPLTRHALEAFMDGEPEDQWPPELRSQALHELAWREVGLEFLQNDGLGLKNGGPIQPDQLSRYSSLFKPNDDGLLSLSRALVQLEEAHSNTPDDVDGGHEIVQTLQQAAGRLLTIIRLVMNQQDWMPPASQLKHFLEMANQLGHRHLGQELIPPVLLKAVKIEAKRMMAEVEGGKDQE